MIRPKLRQLEYLITLDDDKSFSKAAENCNVTQSTLSAGIKDLENTLGQQLVNRAGRSVITLTAFGNEVAAQARHILNDVDHIVANARRMQSPLSGIIRLGVIPTIAPYFLPHILGPLQRAFPQLQLQLYEDLSERLIEKLNKRQLDTAIIAFPYDTEGMECHDLFKEDFYLAAPKNKNIPDHLSIKDIKPEELLLLEDGHCLRDHALSACDLQLPTRQKTFSATSLATLIQMVGHGYGVTLLPEMVIKHAPMPDNIEIIPFKSPAPSRQIGMVWSSNSPQKRDLQVLLDSLSGMTM
tara:strand:- start:1420 stop:2310 length:891 start_codon:yes stop_codon:yes gene_type:complete